MIFHSSLSRLDGLSTNQQIKTIANHIRNMQEELEYRLTTLDSSNITSINIDETTVEGETLGSLTVLAETVEGLSHQQASLTYTVSGLSSTVSSQGQSLSRLEQTSNSLSASVEDLQTGEKTYLRMDASGVTVVDGNGQSVSIGKGNLSLTGAIYWADLGSDAQGQVTAAQSTANSANSAANNAITMAQQIANGQYSGTFINGTSIYSPTIYGNTFNVLPRYSSDTSGSFSLYGYHGSNLFQFLSIQYASATPPYINFSSPGGAYAQFNFYENHFYGNVCLHSSYGTSLPSSGTTGQVFFLIE